MLIDDIIVLASIFLTMLAWCLVVSIAFILMSGAV